MISSRKGAFLSKERHQGPHSLYGYLRECGYYPEIGLSLTRYLRAMKENLEREAENAPGDFYVAAGQCIICMFPVQMAPELVGFCDAHAQTGSHAGSHCYFKRQPKTREEIALALESLAGSCCQALRYAGNDPEILERLQQTGFGHLCDHSMQRP